MELSSTRSRPSTPRETRPAAARRSRRRVRETTPRQIAVARELAEEFKKHQLYLAERTRSASFTEFALVDISPVPLALLSRRGVIVSAGKPLFDLLELPSHDILFHSVQEFLQAEDLSSFFKFLVDCRNKRRIRRAEFFLTGRDHSRKRVLLIVSPLDDPVADKTLFRAAFVELTEGEQHASDPRISQEDTRLMAAIDGIVWEADYPMRFTFVSRQAERILGFPAKDWLRDPDFWAKHIYHEDREHVLQARAHAVRKLNSHVLHYRMVTANRSIIYVKDSAVIVAGAPGWTRISGMITDVTDLEQAREDLKHANESLERAVAERTAKMEQSLEAMETLYGIAHDLKAPLRGLQGFIGILMSDYGKLFDENAKLYAHRCELAVRRMGELIEAVLAYGRLNHTVPELIPIHLNPLISRILQTMEPEITARNANIQRQMTFPIVIGNPFLLEQVFTNLIANALKFTRPGTRPEISISATQTDSSVTRPVLRSSIADGGGARLAEASERRQVLEVGRGVPAEPLSSKNPSIHQSAHPPGHPSIHSSNDPVVRVTVTDNGIGISPEFTKRTFGMFQKLHRGDEYAGTGIGLAVVKRAVELMNGRVGVFSHPNQGSSFWIELPSA